MRESILNIGSFKISMKRGLLVIPIILLFFILAVLVYAQEQVSDISGLNQSVKNITGSLNDRTENLLEKEVNIPDWFGVPARVLFGIEQGILWQNLIILLGVWIMIFIILVEAVSFVPFLKNKIISFFVALIITCLISITGAVNNLALFFWNFGEMFNFLKEWSILQIILTMIGFAVVIFAAIKFNKLIRNKYKLDKAEGLGMKAGAQMKIEADKFEKGSGI